MTVDERLGRIEEIVTAIKESVDGTNAIVVSNTKRITVLEVWRGYMTGGAAVFVIVVPLVWELLRRLIA